MRDINTNVSQWKAFIQLQSLLASVAIWHPSKRASLEQFGHEMAATATPRLDKCQTPQQTAEVNAFDCQDQEKICHGHDLVEDSYVRIKCGCPKPRKFSSFIRLGVCDST